MLPKRFQLFNLFNRLVVLRLELRFRVCNLLISRPDRVFASTTVTARCTRHGPRKVPMAIGGRQRVLRPNAIGRQSPEQPYFRAPRAFEKRLVLEGTYSLNKSR